MPSKQTEMGEIDGEIPTPNVIINATSRDANVQKKAFSGALALAAIAAYMGSIGMGSVVGFSSPTVPLLKTYDKPLRITDDEADWFASLVNVGALIAGPIAGVMVDQIGRKSTLVLVSVPFVLGYLLIAYSTHLSMLLVGRILTGLSTGIVSLAVPIYIAEISPPAIRGQLSTIIQLGVTIGLVYSFSVGYFLYWTWLAIACTVWPILMLLIMTFMHETPFWLIKHGLPQPALKALVFLRNTDWDVSAEFQELSDSAQKQNLVGRFSLGMLKEPTVYKPLIVSLFIMSFQQLCGINAVIFYTVSIFHDAGSTIDPKVCTIIVGLTQFVGTLAASFIIDKLGRRILLLISGSGMCISLIVFGVYYYMVDLKGERFQDDFGWIPLVSLITYNLFFAVGYGPIPWILLGELFPLRVKGFASGLSTAFNWFCAFLITKEFSHMLTSMGQYGTYFFFATSCLFSCIFVFIFLPETKGHSFDEIEEMFASKPTHVILDETVDDDLDS